MPVGSALNTDEAFFRCNPLVLYEDEGRVLGSTMGTAEGLLVALEEMAAARAR